jgi:HlyD family secretion protein
MKKKKTIRYIIIAAVVLIILLVIGKKFGWLGKEDQTKVSTELVKKRTITETVSASGKIQPEVEVKISPDVSGEVIELNVKEGDKVKKGDLLAKINPDIYVSNVNRMVASLNSQKAAAANAKARLAQAKATFINAKASYERNETLFKQNAISQAEYDQAKSNYEVAKEDVTAAEESYEGAKFNVQSSEASVKESKDNLNKTSIFAPVDGTISKLSVEKGERVVGTSQMAGTEMMRIADLNEMEVNVSVNENDIVRVKLGDTTLIEVDAYLNRKFKGIVTEIANSADVTGSTSTDQVTNFNVKIRILKESYSDLLDEKHPNLSPFRPGMSASVDIQTKTVYNVLCVPIQAVTTRDDTAKAEVKKIVKKDSDGDEVVEVKSKAVAVNNEFVFTFSEDKVKMQKVKTGIQDNTYIEILEGLSEKQEIITAPYTAINKKLKDGMKVKKVDKSELFSEGKGEKKD